MKKHPCAHLTLTLDEEHTAILDSLVEGKEGRNRVALRCLESVLQDKAVEHGASPIAPRERVRA